MIKKFIAFTLGEILIALGVIGVVASLVLPQIISGKKAGEAKAQFNTAYSLVTKAVTEMDADNIPVSPANYTVAGSFYPVFKNYFKVTIECGNSAEGKDNPCGNVLTLVNSFIINNGMIVGVDNSGGTRVVHGETLPEVVLIAVDLNGNKLPNKWGQDIFVFELTQNGVLPEGAPGTEYDGTNCDFRSGNMISGMPCAYQAVTDQEFFKKVYNGH